MTILSVSDIRLEYGTDIILQKINFSINEGDRLGIVGVNGAGKSTLLRIIAGTTEPSGGQIFMAKGKTVGMLEQNAMLESEKTLTEIGDKLSDADKADVTAAVEKLKETVKGGNTDAIKADTEALEKAFYALSEKLYAQSGAQGADFGAGAQGDAGQSSDGTYYNADYEDKTDGNN